ncbi:MAG TPA: S8 family serine peptidase [Candidatus Thermoplasmatota archaeon]|nr:S8 family serine peptidase [Candidatus Thermoplasmatota archaeon]
MSHPIRPFAGARPTSRLLGLALLLTLALPALAAAVPPAPAAEEPQRFVVGYARDVSDADLHALLASGATAVLPLSSIDAVIVLAPPSLAARLSARPDVLYVEPDGKARFFHYQTEAQTGEATIRAGLRPLPGALTGAGVTVAVVDSGVDTTHPDLAGQVVRRVHFDGTWTTAGIVTAEQRDLLAETSPGANAPATTHGLSVGGVLAGTGAAAQGVDMRGVAPGVRILDVDVCCSGIAVTQVGRLEGWGTDFLLAYDYILRHKDDPQYPGGIRVATNQWGFGPHEPYPREALTAILRAAVDAGITVIFSAGNSGPSPDTVAEPQKLVPELITVGVSCPELDGYDAWLPGPCGLGDLAVYSSRGPAVDLVAPAAGIWSPKYVSHVANGDFAMPRPGLEADAAATLSNKLWYGVFGGTSAAAPYVAGVVALMLEADPTLTPAEIESILKGTADSFGHPVPSTAWGHGEVRALAAVLAAMEA